MKLGGRLPSITFTLAVIGVFLLAPLLAVTSAQWRSASARVDSATRVQQSSDRLGVLLQLGPAINNEILSTGWTNGRADLITELPDAAIPILSLNVASTVEQAQARVDQLSRALADNELDQLITEARQTSGDDNAEVLTVGVAYDPVIGKLRADLDDELIRLNFAASATGDQSITRSARLAEAAGDVQTSIVGMDGLWAQLISSDFFAPEIETIQLYNYGLVSFTSRSAVFDASLPSDGPLRDRWDELQHSVELETMLAQYESTALKFNQFGLPETEAPLELDLSDIDFAEAISLAAQISGTLEAAEEVNERLDGIVDTAVDQLEYEAANALDRAEAEQDETILWLLAAAALFITAALAVVVFVSQPVRRMAEAANRLSKGDLDVRVPERGPSEVRIGSKALNEALSSLKTAEAQAVALAEERLDDPILKQKTPGSLGASLQAAVERLASSLADRDRVQRQIEYDASHDGLTRLANRRAVLAELDRAVSRARRSNSYAALLFIDLDDFKTVNDIHGHYFGDTVLKAIGDRLNAAVRDGDLAGRFGGDEFVVVAQPLEDTRAAVVLADRILEEIVAPIVIDGITVIPNASIGVGISTGDLTGDEMLRDADLAVYRAKGNGKARVHVCDDSLRAEFQEQADMEHAIERAIETNEFVLHYQPTVRAGDHQTTLVEALVRWETLEDGLIMPGQFIPVAERTSLILKLDQWVLDAAARQLSEWSQQPETALLEVAVNISARHLGSGTLATDVQSVIDRHAFNPSQLTLEITETALLHDLVGAVEDLRTIRELGVRIALDDFGTGYMSLTNLRSLPVDVIKIDQSFTAELEDHETRSLVQLIIDTGHLLNMEVTAEGVETERQADDMTSMGADLLQGYFFSRPKPACEIIDMPTDWVHAS